MALAESTVALLSGAMHEAGHAVIGVALGFDLDHVSINERGGGLTLWREKGEDEPRGDDDANADPPARAARVDALREDPGLFEDALRWIRDWLKSEAGLIDHLTMLRAARAAHELIAPFERAIATAADDLITEDLLICAVGDPRRMAKIDLQTRAIAAQLVREHETIIRIVAVRLLERRRLEGREVRAIMESPGQC